MCQRYSKPKVGRFLRHGVNVNKSSAVAEMCDRLAKIGDQFRTSSEPALNLLA